MTTAIPKKRHERRGLAWLIPALYILFLLLPIYWLLNMSLKTNEEILSTYSLWPRTFTFANYLTILTDKSW
jgi:glycerol transport system permease protein